MTVFRRIPLVAVAALCLSPAAFARRPKEAAKP